MTNGIPRTWKYYVECCLNLSFSLVWHLHFFTTYYEHRLCESSLIILIGNSHFFPQRAFLRWDLQRNGRTDRVSGQHPQKARTYKSSWVFGQVLDCWERVNWPMPCIASYMHDRLLRTKYWLHVLRSAYTLSSSHLCNDEQTIHTVWTAHGVNDCGLLWTYNYTENSDLMRYVMFWNHRCQVEHRWHTLLTAWYRCKNPPSPQHFSLPGCGLSLTSKLGMFR